MFIYYAIKRNMDEMAAIVAVDLSSSVGDLCIMEDCDSTAILAEFETAAEALAFITDYNKEHGRGRRICGRI